MNLPNQSQGYSCQHFAPGINAFQQLSRKRYWELNFLPKEATLQCRDQPSVELLDCKTLVFLRQSVIRARVVFKRKVWFYWKLDALTIPDHNSQQVLDWPFVPLLGRLFNKDGNLAKWWSNKSIEAFKKKTECLKEQYSSYVFHGKNVSIISVSLVCPNKKTTPWRTQAERNKLFFVY